MRLVCVSGSRSHFCKLELAIHGYDLVFICLKDAVRLTGDKFLMNYARLHEVVYMYAFAEVGPCAHSRYDSHGRSVPDVGTCSTRDCDPSAKEQKLPCWPSLFGFSCLRDD